jgi:hypothetical protein
LLQLLRSAKHAAGSKNAAWPGVAVGYAEADPVTVRVGIDVVKGALVAKDFAEALEEGETVRVPGVPRLGGGGFGDGWRVRRGEGGGRRFGGVEKAASQNAPTWRIMRSGMLMLNPDAPCLLIGKFPVHREWFPMGSNNTEKGSQLHPCGYETGLQ